MTPGRREGKRPHPNEPRMNVCRKSCLLLSAATLCLWALTGCEDKKAKTTVPITAENRSSSDVVIRYTGFDDIDMETITEEVVIPAGDYGPLNPYVSSGESVLQITVFQGHRSHTYDVPIQHQYMLIEDADFR